MEENKHPQKIHEKNESVVHRILKGIVIAVIVIAAAAVLGIGFLTLDEYRPADTENIAVENKDPGSKVVAGEEISIMTWNIGYGALGDNADFFMDGGSHVRTADKTRVYENLTGIVDEIESIDPNILFLQEADRDSDRSYHVDEYQEIGSAVEKDLGDCQSTFAHNYKVAFVPYPIPPIGKVESGIATFSSFTITDSERIQLPCPFKWPVRLANLKRCLMVDRVDVFDGDGNDTGKDLVLVNLHLEAYDSGEGKAAQTAMLRDLLEKEASMGNYVIAGGDFNQTFSNCDDSAYPVLADKWHCGKIDISEFDDGWQFKMDAGVPTCRSLDRPLDTARSRDPADFQYYMIDGFICSSNIQVNEVRTQDAGFKNSDHNPVVMNFTL